MYNVYFLLRSPNVTYTLIIYLKIESYVQSKIKNSQRFDACNASYSCDNRNDKCFK